MSAAQLYDHNGELRIDGTLGVSLASVVLGRSALNVHTATQHNLLWDAAYDNATDYNPLAALPAGIGFTAALDGSSGALTFTTDGVWTFDLVVYLPASDAAGTIQVTNGNSGLAAATVGPVVVPTGASSLPLGVSETLAIPSGASTTPTVNTLNATTAGTYNVTAYLAITRLA